MASDTVKRSQLTFQHFVDSVELSLVPKLSAAVAKELRKEAEQTSKSERKRLMTSALALGDAMGMVTMMIMIMMVLLIMMIVRFLFIWDLMHASVCAQVPKAKARARPLKPRR